MDSSKGDREAEHELSNPISIPPVPSSRIRLTRAHEVDANDVEDESVMFHPSCEALGCERCGAYQDRTCALLYGVPSRRTG